MTVRLIAISRPTIEEIPTTSALLAYCARVSSTANQMSHETGPRLIRSLVKRSEWSPLEMVHLTMEIETTRDIARQILRHRSFSFQEFSQRYAVADDTFAPREARLQDHKDRQNSIETDDHDLQRWWSREQLSLHDHSQSVYQAALNRGIAKEQARVVLPEGITPSRLYMAGSLRSWIHYVALRADKKTQKEHRSIAIAVKSIILTEFPDLKEVLQ